MRNLFKTKMDKTKCQECKKLACPMDKEFLFTREHCSCFLDILEGDEREQKVRSYVEEGLKDSELFIHVRVCSSTKIFDKERLRLNVEYDSKTSDSEFIAKGGFWSSNLQIMIDQSSDLTSLGTFKER